MQDWPTLFQRHTLESMTCCVPQIQGFSDAFLSRVFLYDTLLDADTLADEPSQLSEVEFFEVETEQLCKALFIADETVLEHLGIA